MKEKFTAQFVGNRIIVWDISKGQKLYSSGFIGKPLGVRKPKSEDEFRDPSEISFFEASYLIEKKKLKVVDENEKILKKEHFLERCRAQYLNFDSKMKVYKHLKDLGYVVRPGLKFGVDFSVYTKGPGLEHSPYLVQIIESEGKINPIELVRAGRLATTVRKNFVISTVIKKKLHFFVFNRYKP